MIHMYLAGFNPFVFTGRIGRLQLVAYYLLISVAIYLASIMVLAVFTLESWPATLLGLANSALRIVAPFSYSFRRLHDIGHSGYFALLLIVPYVSIALVVYLLLAPGAKGPNRYGTRASSAISDPWAS